MSSNINAFAAGLDAWTDDELPKELTKVHRASSLDLLKRLIRTTPVDTGRARANWQTNNSAPPTGDIVTSGTQGSPTPAGVPLARETSTIMSIKAPSISYLSNNLPYIAELNDGSSTQAPKGFVEIAVAEVERR
jgi:hypothetical protein